MIHATVRFGLSVIVGVALAVPASAQSLADVARREQARRDGVEAPSKTYTNADLTPDPRSTPGIEQVRPLAVEAAVSSDDEQTADVGVGDGGPAADTLQVEGAGLDEAYWRRRAAGLKLRVERARVALDEVSRPSAGNAREQARIAELRQKAEEALARAEEEIWGFMRDADARGVPPAWVR
jgi:hypothetical protein